MHSHSLCSPCTCLALASHLPCTCLALTSHSPCTHLTLTSHSPRTCTPTLLILSYFRLQDYTHTVKLMRNLTLDTDLTHNNAPGVVFSMETAWNFFQQNLRKCKRGLENDIYPTDKMDIDPVLNVCDPKFTSMLLQGKPEEQQLGKFLCNMHWYFNIWNSNKNLPNINNYSTTLNSSSNQPFTNEPLNINNIITQLASILTYFKGLNTTGDIVFQIEETLTSLRNLHTYLQTKYKYSLTTLSILSTLAVENFFSQVRCKVRYPNLYEFACVFRRIQNEIIKRNATDYLFPVRKERVGKKYNNQEGIEYSVDDIEYLTRKDKTAEKHALYTSNAGIVTY
jgi:hypothetical protein